LTPAEQLKGVHVACSHTGLIEKSLAFDVESEDPNDAPETKMKELPVDGTFDAEAKVPTFTKSHEKAPLKADDRLEIEITAEEVIPTKTAGLLQAVEDELAHTDARLELRPALTPAV